MIIAAYAGCGKTTMAREYPDKCIEIVSMPYTRILPVAEGEHSFESEKAALHHINNPIFPYNMISEILEAEQDNKYVIIPTIKSVIDIIQKDYGRTVVLCYPEDDMEDEYRKRYMERGNSEEFCQIFIDGMKDFLVALKANKDAFHLPLAKGEYLSDKYKEFEDIYSEFPNNVVDPKQIYELREDVNRKKKDVWIEVYFFMDHVFYKMENIEDPDERLFIYNFGKQAYESSECVDIRSYNFDVIKEVEKLHVIPKIVDRAGLMAALEKHEKMAERFCK